MTRWFDSQKLSRKYAYWTHKCMWCGICFQREWAYKVRKPILGRPGFHQFWVCEKCGKESLESSTRVLVPGGVK